MGTLEDLKEKCINAGLAADVRESAEHIRHLSVMIPIARETREIEIGENEDRSVLQEIEASDFERFRLMEGYNAVWSESKACVECEVDSIFPLRFVFGRFREAGRVSLTSLGDLKVSLGPSSIEYSILVGFQRPRLFRLPKPFTLRIDGIAVTTHDEARTYLRRIGDSALFDLDLNTEMPFILTTFSEPRRVRRLDPSRFEEENQLTYEYDSQPMALYWYARLAYDMPLLAFLAHYQVLEYYFPNYSQIEAQKMVRNILKDPRFNVNSDSEITRLLNHIKASKGGQAFGDERSQLRATIEHCVSELDLATFIENGAVKTFYADKKRSKKISQYTLSSSDSDLRQTAAMRVYEIRCRIVHTKDSDEGKEPILPFSLEAAELKSDVALIQFISRKALVAGSRPYDL